MQTNEIIAERKLIFVSPDGVEKLSSIQIGLPNMKQENDYCCEFEIPDIKQRRYASGADGVQAIILTICMIASNLDVMQSKGWKILWPDTRDETSAREIFEVDQFSRIT